jgi:hypothetical protein
MKIHPMGTELFHVDGRTDGQTGEAIRRFSQFCERVKEPIIADSLRVGYVVYFLLCMSNIRKCNKLNGIESVKR